MGGIIHKGNFPLVEFSIGGIFHRWNFPRWNSFRWNLPVTNYLWSGKKLFDKIGASLLITYHIKTSGKNQGKMRNVFIVYLTLYKKAGLVQHQSNV